ncbi:MAG TPA: ribosome small subunit-dependent GTPase A [Caldimonas sp.]|jgi:ribosome biogenesis GTPase|nr:ribosome small subunit-dependent GTPase A [Caldimonas sp.]HEX2540599.1 ribosome small subunit-dependent GTPase A [Caldimonas sp.]
MPSSPSSAEAPARVVTGHGRHVVVETADGRRILCHSRGKKSTLVVGDLVRWTPTGDEGVVDATLPRRNLLHRQDEWKTKEFAANIDQLLIVVAAEPVFSESQLARALIAANAAGIEARIVLNKRDLPTFAAAEARLRPYQAMGVEILAVALKNEPDAARSLLRAVLASKATLVLGPSGAGKSTLVNLMVVDAGAQVGDISRALNSGRHTTTATQWYWLDDLRQSALIDSPGFQEFGLRHIAPEQLAALMPDIGAHADACRFYNCTHLHEPGCGVLEAVRRGELAKSRHRIYVEIRAELAA